MWKSDQWIPWGDAKAVASCANASGIPPASDPNSPGGFTNMGGFFSGGLLSTLIWDLIINQALFHINVKH